MALPVGLIVNTVGALMSGPLNKILDLYVKDVELRRKLQAELEGSLVTHLGKSLELEQAVVLAEVGSEHWITYAWRPMLMMLFMAFLVLVGFVLPMADLFVGKSVAYNPRWASLPEGFWQFLSVGVGGYIGGRSLEKIAGQVIAGVPKRK
jgi:Holin of 3TMs, for gene-transfer release